MKISNSSLHFKFNEAWADSSNERMPITLCGYFWFTIFNVFRSFVVGVMGIAFTAFCLSPLLRFFTKDELVYDIGTGALYLYSLIAVILISGLFFNKSSFGRVLLEYLKTFKTKMCPLIEYEGKPNDSSGSI